MEKLNSYDKSKDDDVELTYMDKKLLTSEIIEYLSSVSC